MSQVQGAPLDARAFWDFYAKAVELDIPIFVHPALMPHGYAHALDHDLARVVGREFDLTLAATRLIAGGVLEAFPALKLVIAHFGGGIAAIKERLQNKAYRFGTKLPRAFAEYFDLLYFYAMSLLAITLTLVYGYRVLIRRAERFATVTGRGFRPAVIDLGRSRYVASAIAGTILVLLVAFPVGILLLTSLLPYFPMPPEEAMRALTCTLVTRGNIVYPDWKIRDP
jgi:hypothetical protein